MHVVRLRLHAFRNHQESVVELGDGPVLICGPNGAGKTAILEAIHLLSVGRSFRTADTGVILAAGADRAMVEADVALAGGRSVRVGVELGDVAGGKRWMFNGTARPRHRDVAVLRSVVFAPDDLSLVKGGPSERREYLDEALVSVVPRTAAVLADYQRVLKQRNVLLRSIRGTPRGAVPSAFATWTEMLADKGADLVVERVKLLRRLAPKLADAVASLSGDVAAAEYVASWSPSVEVRVDEPEVREVVREAIGAELAASRRDELDRGVTLVGPHRDDVALRYAGRDVRTHASQGEQRVVSLGLRLAHLAVLEETTDDPPVLLLDDVFSELDPQRRGRLLDQLPRDAQTLMTTTSAADSGGVGPDVATALSASGFGEDAEVQVVYVVDGKVIGDAT